MTESAQEKLCNVSCTNAPKPIQLITFIYAYFYAPHHNSRKSRDNLGTAWFWVSRMQRSIIRNTNGLFALRFAIRCWTRAAERGGRGILCNLAAHWQSRFKNVRLGCMLLHNNFIFLVFDRNPRQQVTEARPWFPCLPLRCCLQSSLVIFALRTRITELWEKVNKYTNNHLKKVVENINMWCC